MTPSKENQIMAAVKQVKDLAEQMAALNDKVDEEQSKQIKKLERRVTALEKVNSKENTGK